MHRPRMQGEMASAFFHLCRRFVFLCRHFFSYTFPSAEIFNFGEYPRPENHRQKFLLKEGLGMTPNLPPKFHTADIRWVQHHPEPAPETQLLTRPNLEIFGEWGFLLLGHYYSNHHHPLVTGGLIKAGYFFWGVICQGTLRFP